MSQLFRPFRLAGATLSNRLVFPAIAACFAQDSKVSERMIDYYRRRANGVGMVIVEPGVVHPDSATLPGILGNWSDECLPGLRRLALAIKAEGAVAMVQAVHSGPQGIAREAEGVEPVGPSAIEYIKGHPVRALTAEEIPLYLELFAAGAERAAKAGFDGIEVHCAHLYLLSSFLSPLTNRRADAYGGSTEGRAKIVVDLLGKIRRRVGQNFLISVRMNAMEASVSAVAMTPEEARRLAVRFEEAGADMIHVTALASIAPERVGRYLCPASPDPGAAAPPGMYLPWIKTVKEGLRIPVIGVGKIDTPELAERALAEGCCDLVAVGRAMIADPLWAQKAKAGRAADIRRCTYCRSCYHSRKQGRGLICVINEEV
ncbi:hypothetical protein GTO89_06295 [Heliobacterium gestii]|uniref:NADH:flavin oxidoreductase/NADH oxidase N-terminal domain-containing protein n=1 Tax=Heliomicrobium gestii TaxID=2699 RepID=A0A845L7G1_HELGE|nr:NADH:flavin oxidoreductase [Heliomicrobium gestii]MBM7866021.1 2,4-dienoyl-CoA reductase-like NADH-dependent reductase (Old Yellow Enzyme family) [Heliomicrobium gestii]MZP42647.1 hypothetical protein [Heliomicrobium gestii]